MVPLPRDSHNASHVAFFDEIALRGRRGEAWARAAAGLVVLRAIDGYLAGESVAAWGIAEARREVNRLSEGDPQASALERLLDMVEHAGERSTELASALMAYGRSLEDCADWNLAVDVYRMTLRSTDARTSSDGVLCYYRLGHCFFQLNAPRQSKMAFGVSARLALRLGDREGRLRAQVGLSRLVIQRGDLPRARRRIVKTLARARRLGLRDVHARGLLAYAELTAREGRHLDSLRALYVAMPLCRDVREIDRIRSDIAYALFNLGLLEAARYVYTSVIRSCRETYVRWTGYANLLEIASLAGDLPEFKRLDRVLATETLPAFEAAATKEILGDGYLRFGDIETARSYLKAALAESREHGFNELAMRVERNLDSLAHRSDSAAAAVLGTSLADMPPPPPVMAEPVAD